MLDALEDYLGEGGRVMYIGGNGFYWVIACHPEKPRMIEVRKREARLARLAGAARRVLPRTTGERGGLWRNRGRAPQKLFGVGFAAEGFDRCVDYRRMPDSCDPRAAFIFEGIGDDEMIGDFGLVGGGAAGYEIDRYDLALGTPPERAAAGHEPRRALGQLPARVRGDHVQLPGPGRHATTPRCAPTWSTSRRASGGAVFSTELDRLVRLALAQQLRQQRLADHAQRARPLRLAGAAAAAG